ncbi:type II secretion system protein GspM [Achromobacter pestifer]|uniref:Type II secretion system protein M n=1 Tax=Achromobacter pestifer TaxID=1353889 RepID=A0A6S6YV57_9BURK|nr:type II secretion system protein GspM [Achromobacter pestifer]CAB3647009.1 hypothetical protein LMG3431_02533 [Achromobacter pestifer]
MSSWLNALRTRRQISRAPRPPAAWHAWGRRLRARLQPSLDQVRSRWRGLSRRERQQVLLMVAVVTGAILWLLFTKPALETLEHWDNELPRLRSQAAALQDVLADVSSPAAAPADSPLKPAERVRVSLDGAGLAGAYQLREAGPALQIEFERSTDVSRVMAWLLSAPTPLGMTVQQVTLQRSDDSGSSGQKSNARAAVTVVAQRQPGNGS